MSDIDLGSISTSLKIDLSDFGTGLESAKQMIQDLGSSVSAGMSDVGGSIGSIFEGLSAQTTAAIGRVATVIGTQMEAVGGSILGGLGVAVKAGADFEQTMQQAAANTTMTSDDIKIMDQTVRDLGSHSAAPLSQLAEGFMHISNFGFQAKDAHVILEAAMKSAIATGGNTAKTAELLGQVMHQYGIQAQFAGRTMDMLHLASANGNMTLEQFVRSGGKAITTAANFGVSLVDVTSAISALTRNGFNAATATTQVIGMMTKITNPSKETYEVLKKLQSLTGVGLLHDFTVTGLGEKGLSGVLADIREMVQIVEKLGKGKNLTAELSKYLIPAQRGGIGATALLGKASSDFSQIRQGGQDAMAGKVHPTDEAYLRSQKNLNNQVAELRNNLVLLASDIEKALAPALAPLVSGIQQAVTWFAQLPTPVKTAAVEFAALAGVALLVGGAILSTVGTLVTMGATLTAAGVSIGGLLAVAAPIAAVVGGIGVAVGALAVAWFNDFGHIRESTQAFGSWVISFLNGAMNSILNFIRPALTELQSFWDEIWPDLVAIAREWSKGIMFVVNGLMTALSTVFTMGGMLWNTLFAGTWKSIIGVFAGAWQAIKGVVEIGWSLVAGIVTVGLDMLSGHWASANSDFVKYASLGAKGILDVFSGIFSGLAQLVKGAFTMFINAGKGFISAMITGIKADASSLKDAVLGAFNDVAELLPHSNAKAGPFSRLIESGIAIPATLAEGVSKGKSKLRKSVQDMADEAMEKLKDLKNRLFDATHTEGQSKIREIEQQYQEDRKVDPNLAGQLQKAKLQELEEQGYEKLQEASQKYADKDKQAADKRAETLKRQADLLKTFFQAWAKHEDDIALKQMSDDQKAAAHRAATLNEMGKGLTEFFASWRKSEAESEKESEHEQDNRMKWEFDHNLISLQQYKKYLVDKLKATQEYTDAWIALQKEIEDVDKKASKDQNTVLEKMKQNAQDVFQNAFGNALDKGFGHLFSDILTGFENMLKQMLAQALASGLMNMLTGGAGGFLGGFMSVFGFDDAGNDRTARHWGGDFAQHFLGGAADFANHRAPRMATAAPGGHGPVHIDMSGMHVHNNVDIDRITDQVVYKTTRALRTYRTGS